MNQPTDALTAEAVKESAKKLLKREIDEATGGDMTTLLNAPIRPFDVVEAKPVCDGVIDVETPPVTYEVSRVHHRIRTEERSTTKLNVGVHAAIEDIAIIDSYEQEV